MITAIERTQETVENKRPETSKCGSRSSKRSTFTMTMTNFNKQTEKGQSGSWKDKKTETQTSFHPPKKQNSFKEADYYTGYKTISENFNQSQYNQQEKQHMKKESMPSSQQSGMSSSLGFVMNQNDFKVGMTLDKVLGGGFKKISIYDSGLSEFKDEMPAIDEKSEKKHDEDEESSFNEEEYKNFEIVETEGENEDDVPADVKPKKAATRVPTKESQLDIPQDLSRVQSNLQGFDKFPKKNNPIPKPAPTIYRRKSKAGRPEASFERMDSETSEGYSKYDSYTYIENRDSVHGKKDSRSLSPKIAIEAKKNRFQSVTTDKQKTLMNNTKFNIGQGGEGYYGLKRSPYENVAIDSKSQTHNKFRITSSNKFKSTKENLRTEFDNTQDNFTKKPLRIKALLSDVNHMNDISRERRSEYDHQERMSSRPGSVLLPDKFTESSRKPPVEKMSKQAIEQKLSRDNKAIADKIKKAEKDIIQKYSKMFQFNNEEKKYLLKTGPRIDEGGRRLSTPMRDYDPAKYNMIKKYPNPY